MSDNTEKQVKLAAKLCQNGMSLSEASEKYSLAEDDIQAEIDRQKSNVLKIAKKKPVTFRYEKTVEDAVNGVLCGMSIKEAARVFGVNRHAIKQALREEIEIEEQVGVDQDDEEVVPSRSLLDGDSGRSSRNRNSSNSKSGSDSSLVPMILPDALKKKVSHLLNSDGSLGDEIDVTCGHCIGVLHRRKFNCPGIHCPCILTNNEWVTPKQFSIMGGKASLKNWKNAIRVYGVNIRSLMDSGALDFINHQVDCSGKCSHKVVMGPVGKYQTKINTLEKKQLGTLQQFKQAMSSSPSSINSTASHTPNTTSSLLDSSATDDIHGFIPTIQSSTSHSPGFEALRRAQGGEEQDSQAVFPSPVIKTERDDYSEYYGSGEPVSGVPTLNPVLSISSPLVTSTPIINSNIVKTVSKSTASSTHIPVPLNVLPNSQVPGYVIQPEDVSTSNGTLDGSQGSTSGVPGTSYLIHNGQIRGIVRQVGGQFILQKQKSLVAPDVVKVASAFPDIDSIMKDSASFWAGIKDIGLLDEVFTDIKCSLRSLRHELNYVRLNPENTETLSSVVNALGLQTKLKYKLANHKVASEKHSLKLEEELIELKKKVEMHEKRQQELKRKTDTFDKLLMNKRSRVDLEETPLPQDTAMIQGSVGDSAAAIAMLSDDDDSNSGEDESGTMITDNQLDDDDEVKGHDLADSQAVKVKDENEDNVSGQDDSEKDGNCSDLEKDGNCSNSEKDGNCSDSEKDGNCSESEKDENCSDSEKEGNCSDSGQEEVDNKDDESDTEEDS